MPATKKQNRPAVGAGHARDQKPKPPGCRSGPCPRPEAKTARLQERAMPATTAFGPAPFGRGHGPLLRAGQQGVSDGEHTGLQHIRAQAGAVQHLPYGA